MASKTMWKVQQTDNGVPPPKVGSNKRSDGGGSPSVDPPSPAQKVAARARGAKKAVK